MTPTDQRIALAEFEFPEFPILIGGPTLRHSYPNGSSGPVGNYLSDLNAIHEVEKRLTSDQWGPYCGQISSRSERCSLHVALCFATAPQRAEALLRTIGKWKE